MRQVKVKDLGLIDYKTAWDFQENLLKQAVDIKIENRKTESNRLPENTIIFCEHPHVYTLGKSGSEENLLVKQKDLGQINASYYKINRGGDITYHGPGQLVMYPILDLEQFFTDIHKYLRFLEEAVILTLKDFGITAGRSEGETGVWIEPESTNPRKICAMGVKSSRWITMHGIGFNINTDMNYFNNIIPCGIQEKAVTSLEAELNTKVNIQEVKSQLLKHMQNLFAFETIENDTI
jgi:lipoyl(octanoyl) transferase